MFNTTSITLKRILYILIFIVVLSSCSSEPKSVTFDTITVEAPYEAEISAVYSKAVGNTELSHIINANVEKAIIETLNTPENKSNLSEVLKTFNDEYLSFNEKFSEITEPVWELHIETELSYQSETVITIAISTYEFKGGAHGNDKIKFLNLDAKTGAILGFGDIISNKEAFTTLAKEHFIKSLSNKEEQLKMEDFFFGEPFQLPENIGFSEDGLVLLYNVYEVASYDRGYTEFVIPYNEAEPYLKVL